MANTMTSAAAQEIVDRIERQIAHYEWILSPSRLGLPPDYLEIEEELSTLKHQDLGNAQVDLRQALAREAAILDRC